eukprot:TRINITY_DN13015_c0_g1_i1.p1 TRINITY_DN13015_c0_g1~~TRINITY_DN13015_c0_g1_i1.p1  ORF type:complete len:154 (-),score=36.58 TRINITY_DN13015_c0_g1_i1:656-1117(-)
MTDQYNFNLTGITVGGLVNKDLSKARALIHILLKRTTDGIKWNSGPATTKVELDRNESIFRWLQGILVRYNISVDYWYQCNRQELAALIHYFVPSFEYFKMEFTKENQKINLEKVIHAAEEFFKIQFSEFFPYLDCETLPPTGSSGINAEYGE